MGCLVMGRLVMGRFVCESLAPFEDFFYPFLVNKRKSKNSYKEKIEFLPLVFCLNVFVRAFATEVLSYV